MAEDNLTCGLESGSLSGAADGARMPFPHATGRGLKVAVIDSGINTRHPHILARTSGIVIDSPNVARDDLSWNDELGHGTAVAAAIQEKAPNAEYFAVKLFGKSLAATSGRLLQCIEWAINQGMDLVNLSLGTHNFDYRPEFESLIKKAGAAGTLIVCARHEGQHPVLPGMLEDVISVDVNWQLSRHQYVPVRDNPYCFEASGFPRPLPGVPLSRNLHGVSFAVANMTGLVARACEQLESRSLPHIYQGLLDEALRVQL